MDKIPLIGGLFGWLDGQDIDYGFLFLVVGGLLLFAAVDFLGISYGQVFAFVFLTAPLWLPYVLFQIFFYNWMIFVTAKARHKNGRLIMEIVLPAEVTKSPEAMEFFFNQIWDKGSPDNLMHTYLDGKHPPFFTFELVSTGGDIRFYMTSPEKNSDRVKASLYSQYPGVEVRDVEIDYAAELPSDLAGWTTLAFHFGKKKDSAIPIKTYIDFGLDKMPKEEEKNDPMTPMLEMLATVKPHQRMWIQFIVSAHREKSFLNGQLTAGDTWEKDVIKKCNQIMGRDKPATEPSDFEAMPRLTPGEHQLIEVMERNMGKAPFEFACRVFYASCEENDYGGGLVGQMIRSFSQTEITGRNGVGPRWRTDFNYKMFSDPFNKILPAFKKDELKQYKQRKLDPRTNAMEFKIMTAEEMATIFHLPGKVALTPTLNRVQSARAEAPANLPIGNAPQL